jgi:hypothetical protein
VPARAAESSGTQAMRQRATRDLVRTTETKGNRMTKIKVRKLDKLEPTKRVPCTES